MSLAELKECFAVVNRSNELLGTICLGTKMALRMRQEVELDPDHVVPFIRRNYQVSSARLAQLEQLAAVGRVELRAFQTNKEKHTIDPRTGRIVPADQRPRLTIAILLPGETYQVPPRAKPNAEELIIFDRITADWRTAVSPDPYPPKK